MFLTLYNECYRNVTCKCDTFQFFFTTDQYNDFCKLGTNAILIREIILEARERLFEVIIAKKNLPYLLYISYLEIDLGYVFSFVDVWKVSLPNKKRAL